VDLKEKLEQLAVAGAFGVEDDLDRFGMVAVVAVGGVGHLTAGVTHAGGDDARLAADQVLHAPETSPCEDGALWFAHRLCPSFGGGPCGRPEAAW
jgi:hypothetical protein